MRISELLEDRSPVDLSLKLSGALHQIAGRVVDTGASSPLSLTALLNKLGSMGIYITDDQFRDMASRPPLDAIIANVAGDSVTFIGQRKDAGEPGGSVDVSTTSKTLDKMAKRAASKLEQ